MRGLALILKALYPSLDWSSPEETLKSILGPELAFHFEPAKIASLISGVQIQLELFAVRQERIESALTFLVAEIEAAKNGGSFGDTNRSTRGHTGGDTGDTV